MNEGLEHKVGNPVNPPLLKALAMMLCQSSLSVGSSALEKHIQNDAEENISLYKYSLVYY